MFSFLVRKESDTETRPCVRSDATEKCRNNSAAFPLRDAVIHSVEQKIQLVLVHVKLKTHTKYQGPWTHGEGVNPPQVTCF